jgi:hypothetical protein
MFALFDGAFRCGAAQRYAMGNVSDLPNFPGAIYFFAFAPLAKAFERQHPDVKGFKGQIY